MIGKVKEYIGTNQLLQPKERVIIGVSGGADSVALLDVLIRLKYDCVVAHCNFHLRGEESNRDERFVRELCWNYDITLEVIDFDTEGYAAEHNISIEMAARELRYNWFEELRQKYSAESIAVAHHKDDSVETVLLNLIRGTGIRGLTGIAARNGNIIRPFLSVSRADIVFYLSEKGISYVDDCTNAESIYSRNKIRLDVLPLLESINPSAKESILKTAKYLTEVESIYLDYVNEAKKQILEDNRIDILKLMNYVEPKTILFEILHPLGFNSDVIEQIIESVDRESGKIFMSSDKSMKVVKDRDSLIISKVGDYFAVEYLIQKDEWLIEEPLKLKIEHIDIEDFVIEKDKNILFVDTDKISYPLTLRRWQQGDWFIPFGMKGRKKLSDYFSDNKFSLVDKESSWLLCSDENIVWLVGHRSDDRYRVSRSTKSVLKITLIA